MKKAVIYARYSSHNQTEQSIEGQVRICTDYCKAHDLEITEIYADRAITGKTDARPEFQRLIADSASRKFEAVVVYKTDRFARNKYDSAIYKQKLRKNNIEIHYAAEAIPPGPEGILIESLMEGLAEYYSAELSQKIKRGMNESALKCHSTGSNKPFGYRTAPDMSLVVDENAVRGVEMIFNMYISGEAVGAICERLNALGYRTSRGNKFNKSSVTRIIKNEKYIGVYKYKDIRIEGGIPAIISKEVFYTAQREMERRMNNKAPRKPKTEYLLTGKLFCGHCKSPMTGVSGTGKLGKRYYYYYCNNVKAKKCNKKNASKDWLENLVVEETVKNILKPSVIVELSQKLSSLMTEDNSVADDIRYYEKKHAENQKKLDNLLKAVEDGLVSTTVTARIKEYEKEQTTIKSHIATLHKLNFSLSPDQIEFMLLSMLEHSDRADYNEKIIKTFVSEVYLYDDKLVIFYNIKNGRGLHSSDLKLIESGEPQSSRGETMAPPNKNTLQSVTCFYF